VHFSFEVVVESPKAKLRSGSKRTLGSYHETHKGACLELLGSQLGSGQKPRVGTRVPARDVSTTQTCISVIIARLPWSGEAQRLIGPGGRVEGPRLIGPGGRVESPDANDHEGSATHGIKQ